MRESTGYVVVDGFRLLYRSFGEVDARATVLGLHGGPGASHDYLTPLADLTGSGFRVVLFDQLGCGGSEVPSSTERFTIAHHIEETEGVRSALGLGRVHLVGSSYGGLLAIAVALARPSTLRSLTTVGGLASVPLASAEMKRLVRELPRETQSILERCERDGSTSSPEYAEATMDFYRRHMCRMVPWPADLLKTMDLIGARPVYRYMNGPNEFTLTGTIRDVDLSPRLGEIHLPTLVLGGRYDEVTPVVAEQIRSGIPGARSVTFAQSSHVPFWEERTAFMDTLSNFLLEVDRDGARRNPG